MLRVVQKFLKKKKEVCLTVTVITVSSLRV